jgi:hypothetical protein
LSRKQKLANYFYEDATEDIFDYIPPQKTNQIFTPKKVVCKMLDLLEAETPSIFSDPNKTFADLYVKSGLYLTEIAKRLFKGLEGEIPDEEKRIKHIFENQLFGFAPTPIIHAIAKNFMFGFDGAQNLDTTHLYQLDLTPYAKGEIDETFAEKLSTLTGGKIMKFDCIVGNPPYQEDNPNNGRSAPVYNYFMDLAYETSDLTMLITPARFLFNNGQTPSEWNERMLSDAHFKVCYYNQHVEEIFNDNDIKGGIAITTHNSTREFEPVGTFTVYPEQSSVLKKVNPEESNSLKEICVGAVPYKYTEALKAEHPEYVDLAGNSFDLRTNALNNLVGKIYFKENPNDGENYVQILGLLNNQREFMFVNSKYINGPDNFYAYKVLLPKSNGSGAIGEVLSTPLIGEPLIGHTQTFISIGNFDNEDEAVNCLKYVKTKFARFMLGILKNTQDNSKSTWAKVPLLDFTPSSDIDWSKSIPEIDQQLYEKYGLDAHEVEFIESKVKAME